MKTIKQEDNLLVLSSKLTSYYIIGGIFLFLGIIIAFSLKTSHENFVVSLIIVILLLGGGLLTILFGGKKEISFDKVSGEIIIDYVRHIKSKQIKHPISDALYLSKELRVNNSAKNTSISYNYYLYLSTAKKILISSVSKGMISSLSSAFNVGQSSHPVSVINLANFLNLEIKENSMGEKIASVSNLATNLFKKK